MTDSSRTIWVINDSADGGQSSSAVVRANLTVRGSASRRALSSARSRSAGTLRDTFNASRRTRVSSCAVNAVEEKPWGNSGRPSRMSSRFRITYHGI